LQLAASWGNPLFKALIGIFFRRKAMRPALRKQHVYIWEYQISPKIQSKQKQKEDSMNIQLLHKKHLTEKYTINKTYCDSLIYFFPSALYTIIKQEAVNYDTKYRTYVTTQCFSLGSSLLIALFI
jgi:hypothetical protein